MTVAPFGSWPTPITSERVVEESVRLGELHVDGAEVVWSEGRPSEGGRTQLVRCAADGTTTDLLPAGMNARTAVHEYGGAAWWVRDGTVWFTNWADQRLYRLASGGSPQPVTPEPADPRADRYADGEVSPDGHTIVCVRERHDGPAATQVRNEIVRLDANGPSEPEVLVTGSDFVSSPRLSPDGRILAWIRWNHPSMPWDDTELVVRNLETGSEAVVAGGPGESVSEPRWLPDGALWFLSDRSDWWNLYRWKAGSDISALVRIDAEIGVPAWVFGTSRYAALPDGTVVFARFRGGFDGLAVRSPDGTVRDLDLPFTALAAIRTQDDAVVFVGATPTSTAAIHRLTPATGELTTLRPPRDLGVAPDYLSTAEHITFPAGDGRMAHALFYPPANPDHAGPDGELPPLLVQIHGGPTAAAPTSLVTGYQYWTSRGFAVVDVNYGGSTGYGRSYREELRGTWGVVDVGDCIAAAAWLGARRRVDGTRLTISGGSAGGYTVLAALVTPDNPFAAGADHFGVADLEVLARDTHKFESRYLDRLVGPYPQAREVYLERSPITHVDRFAKPLIVLQGAEDMVVPPEQSEMIVDALRKRGVPVAYLLFDGEQHGFRRAENVRRALDAELSFYGQVLGFELPADEGIEPVSVEHLGS